MKKQLCLLATILVVAFNTTGCSKSNKDIRTLTIYNWQDYIFEGSDYDEESGTEALDSIVDQFKEHYFEQTGEKINVEYYTFETNENMLNVLKTGKSHYDLVCPSDYIIQKMIMEDMLEPFDRKIDNFEAYGSPYIKNEIFEKNHVTTNDGRDVKWSDYAVPYFWGTMGYMYDPEVVGEDTNIATWGAIWNEEYKGLSTLKDSVRDTYCAGVLYTYSDLKNPTVGYSLNELKEMHENGEITDSEYTGYIQVIMNDTTQETIDLVEKNLKEAKNNIYGFEVDSGKSDIVTGKIAINFCWSGDAVYAMDCAEDESDVYLNYVVPEEGSNVWFDGWVMPKGAQVDLAEAFLDFINNPEIAALNMDFVGYTSSVAGQEIFDLAKEWYGSEAVYDEDYNIKVSDAELANMLANEKIYAYDLNYFFGNTIEDSGIPSHPENAVIYSDEINRQFSAQYPSYETIVSCAVMEDFGDRNEAVLEMWVRLKSNDVPLWAWLFMSALILIAAVYLIINKVNKKDRNKRIEEKKKNNKALKKA